MQLFHTIDIKIIEIPRFLMLIGVSHLAVLNSIFSPLLM